MQLIAKSPNHDKYIINPEFDQLTAENFAARLMQAYLMNETDFDNTLINIKKKITSIKTKHLETARKITDLTKKLTKY